MRVLEDYSVCASLQGANASFVVRGRSELMSLLKPAECRDGKFQNPVPTEMVPLRKMAGVFRKLLFGKEERMPRRQADRSSSAWSTLIACGCAAKVRR